MQTLASAVGFDELPPDVRAINAASDVVLGAVGITERGPIGAAGASSSFSEWKKLYGGYTANNLDMVAAVQGYYDGGGVNCLTSRVVHCTDATDPTTKASAAGTLNLATAVFGATSATTTASLTGAYVLAAGLTLVVKIDALADATVTFAGTAATRETAGGERFALADGQTLTVKVDRGAAQTVTFRTANFVDITAAYAAEVAAVINSQINGASASVTNSDRVSITSDRLGTGSYIEVTGGTANVGLAFNTAETGGTGNVSNLAAVATSEVVSLLAAALGATASVTNSGGAPKITSATTGPTSKVLVKAASTADAIIGFDNAEHVGVVAGAQTTITVSGRTDGSYAGAVRVLVAAATSGEADRFNLYVQRSGVTREKFTNLSLSPTDPRFVETIVNDPAIGSSLITVTAVDTTLASPDNLPALGTFGPLTGGDDGLALLADTDFIGGESDAGSTGLRVLDAEDVDIVIVPGRATSAVHNGVITYCEITRAGMCFALLDPPAGLTARAMVTYVKDTASLYNLSEYAAIYWPRVLVANPDRVLYGNTATVVVPPSGVLAAICARVDASRVGGVFDNPAGSDALYLPRNVLGVETREVLDKRKRDLVFPALINPISREKGTTWFVDGARTLRSDGNWPNIGARRGMIFVEKRLTPGLVFMRHRNINPALFAQGERTCDAFLTTIARSGVLRSKDPSRAFYIDFGVALNPPSAGRAHMVFARLGVATADTAEYVNVLVSPDTRALDEELAAAAA